MKRTSLTLIALAAALWLSTTQAPAQAANNPSAPIATLPAIPEGFVVMNGKVLFVQQGRADRLDAEIIQRAASNGIVNPDQLAKTLKEGQMLTLDNKVIRLPDSVIFTRSPAAEADARAAQAAADKTNLDTTLAPRGSGVPIGAATNRTAITSGNAGTNGGPTAPAPGTASTTAAPNNNNVGATGAGIDNGPVGDGSALGIVGGAAAAGRLNGNQANGTPINGNTVRNGVVGAAAVDANGNVITNGSNANTTNNTNSTSNNNGTTNANGTPTTTSNGTNSNTGTPNANGTITHADGTTTRTNANGTTTATGGNTNANGTTNATGTTTSANGTNATTSGTTATGARASTNGTSTSSTRGASGGGGTSGGVGKSR
jgi:hypothetical protein